MKHKKKISVFIVLLLVFALAVGCSEDEHPEGNVCYTVYYVSNDYSKLISQEYWTTTTDSRDLVEELLGEMEKNSEKLEYIAPIGGVVELDRWSLNNGKLTLDFKSTYSQLKDEKEVLTRAAIVKTLTQISDITYTTFQVGSSPLVDSVGNMVGAMFNDTFIYNEGAQINSYEEVKLHLYFADKDGTALVPVSQNIMYNSNISMEKLVVEQLIAASGSNERSSFPTINPETKVFSVTVKDGICYVNLDEIFLTQVYTVSSEVTIYSIVNSLCELTNVNKVQISVNGQTDVNYRESISLTTVFERNLDIVD